MRFIQYCGQIHNYLVFEIEGGDNSQSIGDQVWFSDCGTVVEIIETCAPRMLEAVSMLFDNGGELIQTFEEEVTWR